MAAPKIIGITGYAGVGKDMAAAYLREKYDYHRTALADPIKELLNERFGWDQNQWLNRAWKEFPDSRWGGDGEGMDFSPRSWAQWLGTEAGRNIHGEDCWVRLLSRKIAESEHPRWCVPDIRFPNEASFLRERWGDYFRCIRIHRPNVRPVLLHTSETSVDEVKTPWGVMNDGTPQDLYDKLDVMMRAWR